MKSFLLLLTLLVITPVASQSYWRKFADQRKENNFKEIKIFYQKAGKSTSKELYTWEKFDDKGRLVESKDYRNGKLDTHYKFKHPDELTRILIMLNKKGEVTEERTQQYDLSNTPEPKSKDTYMHKFEHDENGNVTKIWLIKDEKPQLIAHMKHNEANWKIEERRSTVSGDKSYMRKAEYIRDKNNMLIKTIFYDENDKPESMYLYTYKKE